MSEKTAPKPDTLHESAPGVSPESESHPGDSAGTVSESVVGSEVPESILAFRTMTVLLSQIQQKQKSEPSPIVTKEIEQQLKVSDAFANIAVIHRDVIALATKRTLHGHVNILAVPSNNRAIDNTTVGDTTIPTDDTRTPTQTYDPPMQATATQATLSGRARIRVWNSVTSMFQSVADSQQDTNRTEKTEVLLSRNSRDADITENPDLLNHSPYPQILETVPPGDIGNLAILDYVRSLQNQW